MKCRRETYKYYPKPAISVNINGDFRSAKIIKYKRKFSKFNNKPKLPFFDRNLYIKAPKMLVVSEEGSLGVLDKEVALAKARDAGLDLVLINPQADPPVAKIVSWSKFKYEQSKKRKGQGVSKSEVKEMWFKPFIEEGDLAHKVGRVQEFLKKGNKVKLTVRAKGRSPREKMVEVMDRVLQLLSETAEPESGVKAEGRNIVVFVKNK